MIEKNELSLNVDGITPESLIARSTSHLLPSMKILATRLLAARLVDDTKTIERLCGHLKLVELQTLESIALGREVLQRRENTRH